MAAASFDQKIADEICERLSQGESLRSICRSEGYPHEATVRTWARERDDFSTQYARARELQMHALAEEIVEISDDGTNDWMKSNDPDNEGYALNHEHVQRSKLRLDARKWLASKILPKVYGDKVQQEVTGADGAPLIPTLSIKIDK